MGAQEIYDRLRTAPQHHPASVELFDDLTLQAGDIITVKSGTTNYEVPVFSQDIHWNGSAMTTVESTGNEKREPLPALRKREMNNQFVGNSRSYGYAKSAKKKQAQTDQWIEDFENTDLWVNRDTIWAVSGAYQVWTDPTTGNKHIQLKDGALLEVDRGDGIYSTVGSSYAIEQVNNEVVNVIEGSALWTQRDGITGVCGEFSVITDPQTGKKRLKIANGTGLVMTRNNAEFGVYDDGTLDAGVIATKINGVTSTHIQGENIYIGNEQSTTVIAGKCSLSDVTADYISGKIADLSVLNVKAISSSGNITCTNGVIMAPYIYLGVTGNARDMANAITALQISLSGNTYTLKKQDFNDTNWVDVGTFSRAITSWTMGWSNGIFSFTANPQSQGASTQILQGTPSLSGNTYTVPIEAIDSDNPNYQYGTGRSVTVDATGVYNNAKPSSATLGGVSGTGQNHECTVKSKDGTTTTLIVDASGIYTTARTGYTLGKFTQATVTPQGEEESVYVPVTTGGTNYYTAGTAVKYRKASTTTRTAIGNSHTPTHQTGYRRGNEVKGTNQGNAWNSKTYPLYYKYNGTYIEITTTLYYGGSGYTHYAGGAYFSYYDVGTNKVLYEGGDTVTVQGEEVSVTPISGSPLMLKSEKRHKAGTADSTTYYTKS